MARRFNRRPLTDEGRESRRQADRQRIEQAARALLITDGWQRLDQGSRHTVFPATASETRC